MIGTGGTIASEMTEAGLVPELGGADFLQYVPAVQHLCHVDCLQICNIDSTNMTPAIWLEVARAVEKNYNRYDGFVISHGTDTMAYTASALSYLVQSSPKPIVLTGSQKPIHLDITDSKTNLLDSFTVACDGRIPGVSVVFGGVVILGTRARKTFSKSYGAFSSINYPILGVVQDGRLVPYITPPSSASPSFYDRLDEKVSLLKLIPGTSPAQLSFLLSESNAVIIESYGVGGVPAGDQGAFYQRIRAAVCEGKIIAVTTQVQNEGSDLSIYNVGHRLKSDLGVLESYDMTTESVVAKLMWALAQAESSADVSRLFYTPVAGDILCCP
ncbi:MAG: asparaginase [Pseudoflavonifractor sp.]|nr:asparaginase [Pseudoflavonifractor sp.]